MQSPGGRRKIGPEEQTGPRHVAFDRARMPRQRIDRVEKATRARDGPIRGGLVTIGVPTGLVAAPHAHATRSDHRQKRHLIPGKYEADWGLTEPLAPQT